MSVEILATHSFFVKNKLAKLWLFRVRALQPGWWEEASMECKITASGFDVFYQFRSPPLLNWRVEVNGVCSLGCSQDGLCGLLRNAFRGGAFSQGTLSPPTWLGEGPHFLTSFLKCSVKRLQTWSTPEKPHLFAQIFRLLEGILMKTEAAVSYSV